MAGILSAIYFHITVVSGHHNETLAHVVMLHVLPSMWINSCIIYFFIGAATRSAGKPSDHHCPFTANEVGHYNYPFFFGFVLWAWIMTQYATWLSYSQWADCREVGCTSRPGSRMSREGALLFLSAAFGLVVTGLLAFVLFLLARGRTMRGFIETMTGTEWIEPYGHLAGHGVIANTEARLGPRSEWWRYAVPFALSPIPSRLPVPPSL